MSQDIPQEHLDSLKKLTSLFAGLPDTRQPGKVQHPIGEVVAIAFCSMVCGLGHFTEMGVFARTQVGWLRQFMDLRGGPPSHDTFRNVLSNVRTDAFVAILAEWAGPAHGRHVAVDGKTLCGTGIHLVRAWVDSLGISAGQVACAEKSNEIEAIPRLLDALELAGAVVTIDAMGCQREIASRIDLADAYYLLALKGNQGEAYDKVREHFGAGDIQRGSCARSEEISKGRYELRTCTEEEDLSFFGKSWRWAGITSVVHVRSEVCRHGGSGADGAETSVEHRYYLCSLPAGRRDAGQILDLVRAHWTVENRCHWTLDVVFGEDACPVREKTAAQNLSVLRELAMSLLRKEEPKQSLKSKRLDALLDPSYRTELIAGLHT